MSEERFFKKEELTKEEKLGLTMMLGDKATRTHREDIVYSELIWELAVSTGQLFENCAPREHYALSFLKPINKPCEPPSS